MEYLRDEVVDTSGSKPEVDSSKNFAGALSVLEEKRYDLLILDVRLGEGRGADREAGIHTLTRVRERRFLPVIFYTAIPGAVSDLESPLVRVVEKTESLNRLLEEVKAVFATRLPEVNRLLIEHFETIQREYMWGFVGKNWKEFGGTNDRGSLAHLLARRLAISLSGTGIEKLAERLGDKNAGAVEGRVEPMRYYVLPPIEPTPLAGDIYKSVSDGTTEYWVLLTPSCDLANTPPKADFVLLARCQALKEQPEYQEWEKKLPKPSKTLQKKMTGLLWNNRTSGQADRVFFLPAALIVPDLVVDLQQIEKIPRDDLANLKRVASLDSPFAEALVERFTRYYGRVGVPLLNVGAVMNRLQRDADNKDEQEGQDAT